MVTVNFVTFELEAVLWCKRVDESLCSPLLPRASDSSQKIWRILTFPFPQISQECTVQACLHGNRSDWSLNVCVWSGWTVIQHMSVWGSLWFCSLKLNTGAESSWSVLWGADTCLQMRFYKKKGHVSTNTSSFSVYDLFFTCGFAAFDGM